MVPWWPSVGWAGLFQPQYLLLIQQSSVFLHHSATEHHWWYWSEDLPPSWRWWQHSDYPAGLVCEVNKWNKSLGSENILTLYVQNYMCICSHMYSCLFCSHNTSHSMIIHIAYYLTLSYIEMHIMIYQYTCICRCAAHLPQTSICHAQWTGKLCLSQWTECVSSMNC